jgi:hypothetical protein
MQSLDKAENKKSEDILCEGILGNLKVLIILLDVGRVLRKRKASF